MALLGAVINSTRRSMDAGYAGCQFVDTDGALAE
jgi:hypothetical protein